jgi:uncharacterized protein YqjF (DUF2071 family)
VQHDFDFRILERIEHRPWPLPRRPWVMTQTWQDLLFAHWPVDAAVVRSKVPSGLDVDLYNGRAWVGIVPFRMSNVAPRGIPAMPRISTFPELNVRTYVRAGGKPGVFFFSLDAASTLAVRAARLGFNLPYFPARMKVRATDGRVEYDSVRRSRQRPAAFTASYARRGSAYYADPGSLAYFLTERYCLYNVNRRGRPYRLEIHHPPWPLQPADAEIRRNTMAEAAGITLPDIPPILHFAKRQDMVAWLPAALRR